MKMNKFTFLAFLLLTGCSTNDCTILPSTFNSFEEAITLIESSGFQTHKEISHPNSSWIEKLEFFSCDNSTGFLVMTTNGKKYVHQKVPISTWEALESAKSKGGFYNSVLKNNYQLKLTQTNK